MSRFNWSQVFTPRRRLGVAFALSVLAVAYGYGSRCQSALTAANRAPREEAGPQLLASLSAELGAEVSDLVWENSRGAALDLLWGREFSYLRRSSPAAPRDVGRAAAHLTPEGKLLGLSRVRQLTSTEYADERELKRVGQALVFATVNLETAGQERVASLTWLMPDRDADLSSRYRAVRLQGDYAPLKRVDLHFHDALRALRLDFGPGEKFRLTLKSDSELLVDPWRPEDAEDFHFVTTRVGHKPWVHEAADELRDFIGVDQVAQLEEWWLGGLDRLHQLSWNFSHAKPRLQPRPISEPPAPKQELLAWPPQEPAPETGARWLPWTSSRLPKLDELPLAYRATLYPDPERPYSELELVALDMQRLELDMGAGTEDPRPETGPPGSGRVPKQADKLKRLVATFNGGFQTIHGAFGMKAEGRVLVKPRPGLATVRVEANGEVRLGTWPDNSAGLPEAVSYRQNLEPLLADGRIFPSGQKNWGIHLMSGSLATERTALCRTRQGVLIYAWAKEITPQALARGLKWAGCEYAVHLDMNPGHCSFALHQIESTSPLKSNNELLDKRMKVSPERFLVWSTRDFFYLSLRSSVPAATHASWRPEELKQPAPASLPALMRGERAHGNLVVSLHRLELRRARFELQPGSLEPSLQEAPSSSGLSADTVPLLDLGIGHATPATRTGLRRGTDVMVLSSHGKLGQVLVEESGLGIYPPQSKIPLSSQGWLFELPMLLKDGLLTEEASQVGDQRARGALCISPDQALLLAYVESDSSAVLAQTLADEGCSQVVSLDRGSHHNLERKLGFTPDTKPPATTHLRIYGHRPPALVTAF